MSYKLFYTKLHEVDVIYLFKVKSSLWESTFEKFSISDDSENVFIMKLY